MRARRLAATIAVVAMLVGAVPARAEGPWDAKLFAVTPYELGDQWAAERDYDGGDLYQVIYAEREHDRRGEPPMATLTIGLAGNDDAVDGALAGSRALYEAHGYVLEANDDIGDRPGWRGTLERPGVVGRLYVFSVGRAVVYAAALGPPDRLAEVDEAAELLARAQEYRLPKS